jgi:hypothetical protein
VLRGPRSSAWCVRARPGWWSGLVAWPPPLDLAHVDRDHVAPRRFAAARWRAPCSAGSRDWGAPESRMEGGVRPLCPLGAGLEEASAAEAESAETPAGSMSGIHHWQTTGDSRSGRRELRADARAVVVREETPWPLPESPRPRGPDRCVMRSATKSSASGQPVSRHGPSRRSRTSGRRRRLGVTDHLARGLPRTREKAGCRGWSGSPFTSRSRPSSTSTSIPHRWDGSSWGTWCG